MDSKQSKYIQVYIYDPPSLHVTGGAYLYAGVLEGRVHILSTVDVKRMECSPRPFEKKTLT